MQIIIQTGHTVLHARVCVFEEANKRQIVVPEMLETVSEEKVFFFYIKNSLLKYQQLYISSVMMTV